MEAVARARERLRAAEGCQDAKQFERIKHSILSHLREVQTEISLAEASVKRELDPETRGQLERIVGDLKNAYKTARIDLRRISISFQSRQNRRRKTEKLNDLLGGGVEGDEGEEEGELSKTMRFTESCEKTRLLLLSQIQKAQMALESLQNSEQKLAKVDKHQDLYTGVVQLGRSVMNRFLNAKAFDGFMLLAALLLYICVILFTVWRRFPFAKWYKALEIVQRILQDTTSTVY
ncbi:hypothetical protein AAMO2058_000915000 [Amorphochlora amoebiformis]